MPEIVVIAHNVRSTHNVGSLLRTAEGLGVSRLFLTGYTPYPLTANDNRLPHLAQKLHRQISKTALGAETMVRWEHQADIFRLMTQLKGQGYQLLALEQTEDAQSIISYKTPDKLALILGREVEGVEPEILQACDAVVEIPMQGEKESFNVVQAAAMSLYHLTYVSNML